MTLVVAAPMLEDEVAFLVRVELDRIPVEHVGQTFPSSRGKIMSASNISRWRCHRLVEPQVELPGREMWAHGGVTIYIYICYSPKKPNYLEASCDCILNTSLISHSR